jgi:hypothetical protein
MCTIKIKNVDNKYYNQPYLNKEVIKNLQKNIDNNDIKYKE